MAGNARAQEATDPTVDLVRRYTSNADGTDLTQVTHDGDVEFPDWGTHPLATG
jgi:hypothetical protein